MTGAALVFPAETCPCRIWRRARMTCGQYSTRWARPAPWLAAGSRRSRRGCCWPAADPSRVRALAWWNPQPRTVWAPDYPWGETPDSTVLALEAMKHWGTRAFGEAWADEIRLGTGHRPSDEG